MRVGEYCNRDVVVINSDESVKNAAELMRSHHVGDLILLGEQGVPVGIVTDRDLVVEVMAAGLAPESLTVKDILTEHLSFIFENDSLFDALELMRAKKVRRLPVVNVSHKLIGIVTLDDVIEIVSEMMGEIVNVVKLQRKREEKIRV